ncbi:MAG: hypothetical protein AB8B51_17795 [Sedimentitalea sp.]
MLGKSINNALLALRKGIIRKQGDGQAHVDALLTLRGIALPEVRPAKSNNWARKGHMRMLVRQVLREGPQPFAVIAAHVGVNRPELTPEQSYKRTDQALQRMRLSGLVVRDFGPDGCLWKLAPKGQQNT